MSGSRRGMGFFEGAQIAQQENNNQLAQLSGLLGLQGQQMQMDLHRQGLLQKQQQQERINQFAASLPESERAKFLVDPASYIKQMGESRFSKVDPKDYTAESVARFAQTQNYADLVPVRKKDITPAGEVVDLYGAAPGTRFDVTTPHQRWQQDIQFPQQQALTQRGQDVTLAGINRPVFNEAVGGFITPPPVGVGGPRVAPAPRPSAGYSPAVAGAFGMGGQPPQAAPQPAPAPRPVAAPGGPVVTPVPGLSPQPRRTPGQNAVDQAFAREYVDFRAAGGYADTLKQLAQLTEASTTLKEKDLTGPIVGNMPDWARAFTNPEAVATKEAIQEVAQRNLRLILGAQFTEKEGERLIARVYNDRLPSSENKKRVDRLIQQIDAAARAKQDASDYFEQHGTLTGWRGKLYTVDDFRNIDFSSPSPNQSRGRRSTDQQGWSIRPVQ